MPTMRHKALIGQLLEHAAKYTVFSGIAGSGKTTALLATYRAALAKALGESRPGTTLWLSPTNRAQAEIRRRLLDDSLHATFRPNVFTFDGFADEIMKSSPRTVAPLSPAMQRILLRRIVSDLAANRQLLHFEKIAHTSGFLDLVAAFISELKRAETWPEHFIDACSKRGTRQRDRELGEIYLRYQQALVKAGVYDGEGRFWSAREALAERHWGRFANLSLVVVDGFTDFTGAQYKILELLARHSDRLLVSLFGEDPPVRNDLFAKTAAVMERFSESGPVSVETFPKSAATPGAGAVPPGSTLPSAIEHLARRLFANPREMSPATDAQGLEIMAVAGTSGEVRYLAARIKELLVKGIPADDIVLGVRDLDSYAWLIDEVFSAAGIPFACEAGTPFSRLAPFKALVNLLTLEVEDWPFRRLFGLLDSTLFHPNWQELAGTAVRDVSAQLRYYELFEGRERMLAGLDRAVSNAIGEPPAAGVPVDGAQLSARRAHKLLAKLSAATAELRKSHDLDGWSGVTASLVRELGFDQTPLNYDSPDYGRRFGEVLASILYDAARAERVAGIIPVQLTLGEFLGELTDLIERQQLMPRQREEGRVRVLSAEQLRNLDVPYLFLAGLDEKSFPRFRNDDCLYGEGERRELNEHGLSLGHRAVRSSEELLMFYGVVTRARKQLVLTRSAASDEGQPLTASPYLSALQALFDPQAVKERLEELLDPVPRPDRVLSVADARVRGMFDALAGRPKLLHAVCDAYPATLNCLAAVDMNLRRFHTPGFTNFEGQLENPRNIESLREQFSESHEFSATQLEAYAQCPFRFLLEHVLHKEPPAAPGLETDFARRGSLVHDVLAELHRALFEKREETGGGEAFLRGEEISQKFQELLGQKLQARSSGAAVQRALEQIERRLLAEWGVAYGQQWDEYVAGLPGAGNSPPLPAKFETAFGTPRPGIEPTAENRPALVFGEGSEAVRVGGRIDRIDVGQVEGHTVFTVIDYKSGRRSSGKIDNLESGRKLQLALYALAVARLEIAGPDGRPWHMGYWHIKDTGFAPETKQKKTKDGEPLPIEDAAWAALVATLETIIPRLASGIRSGSFPVFNADETCTSGCSYNTICRVAQIRALREEMNKTVS